MALVRTNLSEYLRWASAAGLTPGVDDSLLEDPNKDGIKNVEHFTFDSNPLGPPGSAGFTGVTIATEDGMPFLIYTFPALRSAQILTNTELGGGSESFAITLVGKDAVTGQPEAVEERPVPDSELPRLRDISGDGVPDWVYRSFRLMAPAAPPRPSGFMVRKILAPD